MSNILPKSMHARTKASSSSSSPPPSSSNYSIIRFRFLWFRAKLAYGWYRFAADLIFKASLYFTVFEGWELKPYY